MTRPLLCDDKCWGWPRQCRKLFGGWSTFLRSCSDVGVPAVPATVLRFLSSAHRLNHDGLRVGFSPHFAAFFELRPYGRRVPVLFGVFGESSMTTSSWSSRARERWGRRESDSQVFCHEYFIISPSDCGCLDVRCGHTHRTSRHASQTTTTQRT